eukprot:1191184-Prorocentrum_minimum.AAC.1
MSVQRIIYSLPPPTHRHALHPYVTTSAFSRLRSWKGDECSEENSREQESANVAMEGTQNACARRSTTILPSAQVSSIYT